MDIITIIALLMAIIGIVFILYDIITGKFDDDDLVGIILLAVGVIGSIFIYNFIEYYSANIQSTYYTAKTIIESLNTSESVKQTALLTLQQAAENRLMLLYIVGIICLIIFVGIAAFGLIILIRKHLMPKESNETFRKEGA